MEKENIIGDRIKQFIKHCYKNNKCFSEVIGLDTSYLSRYIKGSYTPTADILLKFYNGGMNIIWLLSGDGDMIADNIKGKELKYCIDNSNTPSKNQIIKNRILDWINTHFDSIENYTLSKGLDLKLINEELNDIDSATPGFYINLLNSGCNMDWIFTGEGSPYTNNLTGILLKSKISGFTINTDIDDKKAKSPSKDQIYRIVRKAIKDELKSQEKE